MRRAEQIDILEVPPSFSADELAAESEIDEGSISAKITNIFRTSRRPIVFRGFSIGQCQRTWTPEYLQAVCPKKKVKIHRSPTPQLDFRNKNFQYETVPFSQLIQHCSEEVKKGEEATEGYWYLRSLGDDPRGKDVADISVQFPELYKDLEIPQLFPKSSFFSSVFRITSPKLQLWTHYDTCDNLLLQVRGRKRIVFFPPWEALNLYLDGDKSLVLDIDNPDLSVYPKFKDAERFEAVLEEGDIVFIPSLWFHNVIALNFSISVNVFWKNLEPNLYDDKDTYGNRDLNPAQSSLRSVEKASSNLRALPREYQDFYIRRMIISLQNRLEILSRDQKQ